jgi:CRP-like cAMP-binding protein
MQKSNDLNDNVLLGGLPAADRQRIGANLKPVSQVLGDVLFRPDERISQVYFPQSSIVSLLTELSDGNGMEVGLVGREGFVGVSAILGGTETKVATIQAAGIAWKMSAEAVRAEFRTCQPFQSALLRYTHGLMSQISQSVVCNARHPMEGRLARWLLMYQDRLGKNEFEMTHEFMAHMLGVRRPGVSEVAAKLQSLGFIKYTRGHITILDREGLERYACECYGVIRDKFKELL